MMTLLLAGCAQNIDLNHQFWKNGTQTLIVAAAKLPKATLNQEGPNDESVVWSNDILTYKFRHYLQSIRLDSIRLLPKEFVKRLRAKNIKTKLYSKEINVARLPNASEFYPGYATKDYRPLARKLGQHNLLIISVNEIGAERLYYGLIPMEEPNAVCELTGQIIDLDTNQILWRYTAKYFIPIKGKWNQPPNYLNFAKALKSAITNAKQDLLDDFFSGI